MRSRRRKSLILGIILLLGALGIGYAYLNTTLNIEGITDISENTWDVHWENISVHTASVEAETPSIDSDQSTISFSIHLQKPGDFYEFTVDAVNDGTIDAMIDEIKSTLNDATITNLPSYLSYSVRYVDDTEILKKHFLGKGMKHTYRIRVEYRNDINPTDLPSESESLNLKLQITFTQSDSTTIHRDYNVFSTEHEDTSNYTMFYLNNYFPNTQDTQIYHTAEDASQGAYYNNFVKLHVVDGIITEGWIGFTINGNIYLMPGGKTEEIIAEDRQVLAEAFGTENCNENEGNLFQCITPGSSHKIKAGVYTTGDSHAGHQGHYCNYHSNSNRLDC